MLKHIFTTIFILVAFIQPTWAGPGHDHDGHNHSEAQLIITPITPTELKIGEENEVILFIQDKQAQPVDVSQFEVVHTKPVHLLIIDPELNDYHHEHPTQTSTGQYAFTFTPQTACSYRIWMDVQLKESDQQYVPVDLKGAKECNNPIDKTVNLESSSQGYDFKLEIEGDVKAGEAVMTKLTVLKDGQPVDFLETSHKNGAGDEFYLDDFHGNSHECNGCLVNGWGKAYLVGSADYAFCGIYNSLAL